MGEVAGRLRFADRLPVAGERTPAVLPGNRCRGVVRHRGQTPEPVPSAALCKLDVHRRSRRGVTVPELYAGFGEGTLVLTGAGTVLVNLTSAYVFSHPFQTVKKRTPKLLSAEDQ